MSGRLTACELPEGVDPASLFVALQREVPDVFWMDAGSAAVEGWSFLGTGTPSAQPGEVRLDAVGVRGDATDASPFRGGWVGWCDYETGARRAGAPVADGADGEAWLRVTRLVAFEHASGRAWAFADTADLPDWAAFAGERRGGTVLEPAGTAVAEARHEPREYAALVERCRELIRAGTAYQLCLTTRFTVPGAHDAVAAYLRLRTATPAHHGGFVRIGDRELLSASPEQFLRVVDGIVRTRPIKGTRPRHTDPAADAALAAELVESAKERAENVMIVDLMRNDLSRVCEPGSIRVDGLWQVESYPAVHQLVSTVSGRVSTGTTVSALLASAFPAGSMTGAPKLSAMASLHALEGGPRGVYAGCFGYIGDDGGVDLAMVIRSIVVDDRGARVGAGGGITWGSEAGAEVAEVATKARAPLAVLGAVLPGPWGSDILN